MCIILVKKKGVNFPNNEILKNCFDNNPDGAGFMYVENNKVKIKKGLMDYKDLIKELNKIKNKKNKNMIIHFRIGTSGKNNRETTHPFPITNNNNYLKAIKFKTDLAVCHNGVIREYSYKSNDLSDTQLFVKNYLSILQRLNKNFLKDSDILKIIKKECEYTKLAFLDSKDNITLIGDFIEDKGILYSNTTYKKNTYNLKNWGNYYDYYDYYSYYDNLYSKQQEDTKEDVIININKNSLKKVSDKMLIETYNTIKYGKDKNYYIDKYYNLYEKISDYGIFLKVKQENQDVIIYDENYIPVDFNDLEYVK